MHRKVDVQNDELGKVQEKNARIDKEVQDQNRIILELSEKLLKTRKAKEIDFSDLKEKSYNIVEQAKENHENTMRGLAKESMHLGEEINLLT